MATTRVILSTTSRLLVPMGYERLPRSFRKQNELGDWAVIDIQRSATSVGNHLAWFVNCAALPAAYADALDVGSPTVATGVWRSRLTWTDSPTELHASTWTADNDVELRSRAELVCARLTSVGLPWMAKLLDRTTFLEMARAENSAIGLVVALVDQGPSDELSTAIDQLPAPQLVEWARKRAQL